KGRGGAAGARSIGSRPLLTFPFSLQIAVFQGAHGRPLGLGGVVVAHEVKEAVNDVAEGFLLERRVELGGPLGGRVEVNVDLAVDLLPGEGGVVEGEGA